MASSAPSSSTSKLGDRDRDPVDTQASAPAGAGARPRFKHNCLPCRKRKSKCDRVAPCSQCVMRETIHECYSGQEPVLHTTSASTSVDSAAPPNPVASSSTSSASASPRTAAMKRSPNGAATTDSADATSSQRPHKRSRSQVGTLPEMLAAAHNEMAEGKKKQERAEALLAAAVERAAQDSADSHPYQRQTPASVTLAALRPVLPPEDKCELLIDLFFVELDWFVVGIFRPWFKSAVWERGLKSGKAISCAQGALLCVMLAMASVLVPPNHPRRDDLQIDRDLLIDHAMYLVDCDDRLEDGWRSYCHRSPTLPLIQAEMIMVYYMMYTGRLQAAYHKLGSALRRAKQIGLFDFRNREWSTTSSGRAEQITQGDSSTSQRPSPPLHSQMDHFASFLPHAVTKGPPSFLELEMKQRLAWDLVILDWWHGTSWRRPPDLPTSYVNLPLPNYFSDEHFDPKTGSFVPSALGSTPSKVIVADEFVSKIRLTQLVPAVRDLMGALDSMTLEERVHRARSIDAQFDAWTANFQVPLEEARQGLQTQVAGAHRRAAQTIINHTSAGYLRCLLHKCFLGDRNAPEDLRTRSLVYARSIMEAIPYLEEICNSQFIYFDPSWCAEHVYNAAICFAYILLTREESATSSRRGSGSSSSSSGEAELRWFAENVSSAVFALRHLGAQSGTARISERILSRLCDSRESLRSTMKRLDEARQKAAEQRGKSSSELTAQLGSWDVKKEKKPGVARGRAANAQQQQQQQQRASTSSAVPPPLHVPHHQQHHNSNSAPPAGSSQLWATRTDYPPVSSSSSSSSRPDFTLPSVPLSAPSSRNASGLGGGVGGASSSTASSSPHNWPQYGPVPPQHHRPPHHQPPYQAAAFSPTLPPIQYPQPQPRPSMQHQQLLSDPTSLWSNSSMQTNPFQSVHSGNGNGASYGTGIASEVYNDPEHDCKDLAWLLLSPADWDSLIQDIASVPANTTETPSSASGGSGSGGSGSGGGGSTDEAASIGFALG